MATLLDIIKQNKDKAQALPGTTAGIQPQSGLMQNLAAQSGKANLPGTGTGPAMSNLSTRIANQATGQQLGQVQQQQQLSDLGTEQDQAQQQQQIQQAKTQLSTKQQELTQDFTNKFSSVVQDLEQNRQKLSQEEYANKLENAYAAAALSNKKYIADLNNAGAKLRLNNASNFKIASQRQAAENTMASNLDDREFQSLFNTNERDFAKMMTQIDANYAWDQYKKEAKAANQQAILSSIGSIGGVAASSDSKPSPDKTSGSV